MREMSIDEALEHASTVISGSRPTLTRDTACPYNRILEIFPVYWIARGRGKNKEGWCTFCQEWSDADSVLYGDMAQYDAEWLGDEDAEGFSPPIWRVNIRDLKASGRFGTKLGNVCRCPNCGRTATVKQFSSGIKSTAAIRTLTYFGRSPADDGVFVAVEFLTVQDLFLLEQDYLDIEDATQITPCAIWVFEPETRSVWKFIRDTYIETYQSAYQYRYYYENDRRVFRRDYPGHCWVGAWKPRKTVNGKSAKMCTQGFVDMSSMRETFDSTRLAWFEGFQYRNGQETAGIIDQLISVIKRPQIEYMYKRGWADLAADVAKPQKSYGDLCMINWRAKTIPGLLGISPKAWEQVQSARLCLTSISLYILQRMREHENLKISMRQVEHLARVPSAYVAKALLDGCVRNGLQLKPIMKYLIAKEINVHDYTDYLGELVQLDTPLDRMSLYPTDFGRAHRENVQRIKIRENEKYTMALMETVKKNRELYSWTDGNYIMRLVPTIPDLFREGNTLHHCVATYAERYAGGMTIICSLRPVSAPDEPRYTVELRPGTVEVVQCRGNHNDLGEDNMARRAEDQPDLDAFFQSLGDHYKRLKAYGHDPLGDGSTLGKAIPEDKDEIKENAIHEVA